MNYLKKEESWLSAATSIISKQLFLLLAWLLAVHQQSCDASGWVCRPVRVHNLWTDTFSSPLTKHMSSLHSFHTFTHRCRLIWFMICCWLLDDVTQQEQNKKRKERQTHYLEKTAYMCKLCLRTCQESRFSVQNLKFWFIISGDDEFLNADFSETLVISLIFTEWLTQMIVVAPHETISVWTGP